MKSVKATILSDKAYLTIQFSSDSIQVPSIDDDALLLNSEDTSVEFEFFPNPQTKLYLADRVYSGKLIDDRDGVIKIGDNQNVMIFKKWDYMERDNGYLLRVLDGKVDNYNLKTSTVKLRWRPIYHHFIDNSGSIWKEGKFKTIFNAVVESDLNLEIHDVSLISVLKTYSQVLDESEPHNENPIGDINVIKHKSSLSPNSKTIFSFDEIWNIITVDSYIIDLREGVNLSVLNAAIIIGADMPSGEHIFEIGSKLSFKIEKNDLLADEKMVQSLGSVSINYAKIEESQKNDIPRFKIDLIVNKAGKIRFRYYSGDRRFDKIKTNMKIKYISGYLYFSSFFDIGEYHIDLKLL